MEWLLLALLSLPVYLLLWPMVRPRIPLFLALCVLVTLLEYWLLMHEIRLFLGP